MNLVQLARKEYDAAGHSGMMAQIVGRCHVGESYRDVVRTAIQSLKDKEATFWQLPKVKRRYFLAAVIAEHASNRQLYRDVMGS